MRTHNCLAPAVEPSGHDLCAFVYRAHCRRCACGRMRASHMGASDVRPQGVSKGRTCRDVIEI